MNRLIRCLLLASLAGGRAAHAVDCTALPGPVYLAGWGPLHLFTRLNGSGFPVKAAASDVIGYLAGTKTAGDGLDLIALEAQRHVVPQCAMRVKRGSELGALASYAPPGACGCYYDEVANGSTTCTPCNGPRDCPMTAPVCSYGYCETQ